MKNYGELPESGALLRPQRAHVQCARCHASRARLAPVLWADCRVPSVLPSAASRRAKQTQPKSTKATRSVATKTRQTASLSTLTRMTTTSEAFRLARTLVLESCALVGATGAFLSWPARLRPRSGAPACTRARRVPWRAARLGRCRNTSGRRRRVRRRRARLLRRCTAARLSAGRRYHGQGASGASGAASGQRCTGRTASRAGRAASAACPFFSGTACISCPCALWHVCM